MDTRGYSFVITTGVRLRPVMRGGTSSWKDERLDFVAAWWNAPLPLDYFAALQFMLDSAASDRPSLVNWNMIKRVPKISLLSN